MSFNEYLKEAFEEISYEGEQLEYPDIAEIIANDGELLKQMGREGLSLEDLENDTRKFFDFMVKHLEEMKKKYDFVANPEDLEVDWHYEQK